MQAETTIVKLFGGSEIDPVADPYTIYKRLRSERPALPIRTLDGRTVCLLTRFLVSMYLFPPADPGDLADGVTAAYRLLTADGHATTGEASSSGKTSRTSKKPDRSSKSSDGRPAKTTSASRRPRKPRK